jgi:hypothetical protein
MSAVLKEDHLIDEGPPADDGSEIIVAEYDEPLPEEDDEKQTEAAAAQEKDEENGRISSSSLALDNSRLSSNVEHQNQNSVYAENPLTHSIAFILTLDFFERFAFNGIIFTMPGYLVRIIALPHDYPQLFATHRSP